MSEFVPISISRTIASANFSKGQSVSASTMTKIMRGCIAALERLGHLGDQVVAMKVQPRSSYGSETKPYWYDIRIVLSDPDAKPGKEKERQLEFYLNIQLPYLNTRPLQRILADGIYEGIRNKISEHAEELKSRCVSWEGSLQLA